jgi:hypothetical protein
MFFAPVLLNPVASVFRKFENARVARLTVPL